MSNRQDMGTDKIGLQFKPLVSQPVLVDPSMSRRSLRFTCRRVSRLCG